MPGEQSRLARWTARVEFVNRRLYPVLYFLLVVFALFNLGNAIWVWRPGAFEYPRVAIAVLALGLLDASWAMFKRTLGEALADMGEERESGIEPAEP